ncbi:Regulator of RpoS [Pseudomonas sp. MM227]|uniref:response regulator n=1 Tax=unclassified Pseudomonas TaxID=196821 RepID=UPI0017802292|nr:MULTISPECIES: response regulator [unclassified Pseudomonas]MBD8595084.1 response regulator [Pseudomonas sp. CFBP 8758]MBD8603220.1 response regulator [Pseudomonas sp. CFBP 8771]MBD8731954.1 response regulator [Pseudomonas sp. CFBP 13710]MBD8826890.1 response regulator [Pseudomonas sp. CFBP 13602]CAI3786739.1 Regulator of RpoS [Pseudomonas sp. MM227]
MSDHELLLSDAEREALSELGQVQALPPQLVLVVDDDDDTRDVLAQILALHGIECLQADSAMGAMLQLRANRGIGLLITDLRMGPESGLDLIREVRESERAALPIIIISGDASVKDAITAMHLSVVDFLLKPIDLDLLVKLAREELGLI